MNLFKRLFQGSKAQNNTNFETGKTHKTGLFHKITRTLSLIVVLSFCASGFVGCSAKDIQEMLNVGGANSMYDEYGRLHLQPVSPTLNEYEYEVKETQDENGNSVYF